MITICKRGFVENEDPKTKTEDRGPPHGLKRRPCGLEPRPCGLKPRPCGLKPRLTGLTGLKPYTLSEVAPISVAHRLKCHLSEVAYLPS